MLRFKLVLEAQLQKQSRSPISILFRIDDQSRVSCVCAGPGFEFSAVTRNVFTEAIIVVCGLSTGGNNYYRDNNWCIVIMYIYITRILY